MTTRAAPPDSLHSNNSPTGQEDSQMADETVNNDAPDDKEGEQAEMFPNGTLEGEGKTLKTLVKPGQDVQTTVALSRAEVPLRNGLPDPDKPVRALVTGIFQSVKPTAKREDAGNAMKVTGWKIAVSLRADYVEAVPATDEGLITQRFRAMLEVDPAGAGRLLEQLQGLTSESLALAA
jgi:hypothetical protein